MAGALVGVFLLAGCTPAQDLTTAQAPNPNTSASFDALTQCLESGGLRELVLGRQGLRPIATLWC